MCGNLLGNEQVRRCRTTTRLIRLTAILIAPTKNLAAEYSGETSLLRVYPCRRAHHGLLATSVVENDNNLRRESSTS